MDEVPILKEHKDVAGKLILRFYLLSYIFILLPFYSFTIFILWCYLCTQV